MPLLVIGPENPENEPVLGRHTSSMKWKPLAFRKSQTHRNQWRQWKRLNSPIQREKRGNHLKHRTFSRSSCFHPHCARPTRGVPDRALREHRRPIGSPYNNAPSKLARYLSGMGADDLLLRASNEGLLRPRVARAREIIRLHPLFAS